jgi:hypothetical protein
MRKYRIFYAKCFREKRISNYLPAFSRGQFSQPNFVLFRSHHYGIIVSVSEFIPKAAVLLGTINALNSGQFTLASQAEIYHIHMMLVSFQILLLLKTGMIIAGFPVNHTILNGQMERLNLNGMAKGM